MSNICNIVFALLVNMSMVYSADFIALSGSYNFDINKTSEFYKEFSRDRGKDAGMNGYLKNIIANGGIRYAITDKNITITRKYIDVEWIIDKVRDKDGEIIFNLRNNNGESKIMKMQQDDNKITVNFMNDIFVLVKL